MYITANFCIRNPQGQGSRVTAVDEFPALRAGPPHGGGGSLMLPAAVQNVPLPLAARTSFFSLPQGNPNTSVHYRLRSVLII